MSYNQAMLTKSPSPPAGSFVAVRDLLTATVGDEGTKVQRELREYDGKGYGICGQCGVMQSSKKSTTRTSCTMQPRHPQDASDSSFLIPDLHRSFHEESTSTSYSQGPGALTGQQRRLDGMRQPASRAKLGEWPERYPEKA